MHSNTDNAIFLYWQSNAEYFFFFSLGSSWQEVGLGWWWDDVCSGNASGDTWQTWMQCVLLSQ